MPIYAYRCESCGHAQDVLQKISDPLLTVCPSCGASAYKKQLTAAGFQLKGSGWYVTDFRNGAQPAAATATAPKTDAAAAATPAAAPAADSGGGNSSGGDAGGGAAPASTTSAAAGGCGSSCACH
ncbi:FmdB family zinc ribbon protein [Methylibium sp.]|jgi:putative FmdB family regulatory protein|uniref:FmdB family zinc ribbon protein n=1 Tax=Methylibium sp. TaxID=2067992 RepID=UPI003D145AA4